VRFTRYAHPWPDQDLLLSVGAVEAFVRKGAVGDVRGCLDHDRRDPGVLAALVRQRTSPWVVVLGGVIVLLVLGVVTPAEAFSGFSNPAPITVAALYVVAAGIEKTGALAPVMQRTLGERGTCGSPPRSWRACGYAASGMGVAVVCS